jgi:hypothetical protein
MNLVTPLVHRGAGGMRDRARRARVGARRAAVCVSGVAVVGIDAYEHPLMRVGEVIGSAASSAPRSARCVP